MKNSSSLPWQSCMAFLYGPGEANLQMSLGTVNGQLVHMESKGANNSMSSFDASTLPRGVYVISFVSNEINVIRKIIVR